MLVTIDRWMWVTIDRKSIEWWVDVGHDRQVDVGHDRQKKHGMVGGCWLR